MKSFGFITLMLWAFSSHGYEDASQACSDMNSFFPYKAGIVAENEKAHIEAFDIYCNLAFKGDYRSQFKMAKYYQSGVQNYITPDLIDAYVWARISNFHLNSRKRSALIKELSQILSREEKTQADKIFLAAIRVIPDGARIDMEYNPLDLDKILKKHNKKIEYTGSRIKKKKAPIGIRIMQF